MIALVVAAAPTRAAGAIQSAGSERAGPGQQTEKPAASGAVPQSASGQPLNLGFESGDLRDWTPTGDAFNDQPIAGDSVKNRRGDMQSRHQGKFWVGTFEKRGDQSQGTLTSVPFRVTKPYASFLVAGGSRDETCVELLRPDTGQVIFRAAGDDREDLERVVVDLSSHLGKDIVIRLVDASSDGWGHINFDDFRLHDQKPNVPARRRPVTFDMYAHAGLSPEDAARAMTVPPGFKVTLFAGEPDVVQPIAMAIDDRGRLWIAEISPTRARVPQAFQQSITSSSSGNSDGDGSDSARSSLIT